VTTPTPGRLLILGAGGHARAMADVALACGWTVAGFTDRAGIPRGPGVVGDDTEAEKLLRAGLIEGAVVGVGNTSLDRRAELFARLRRDGVAVPTLLHPRATVSPSSRLGAGVAVFPGAVLGVKVEVGDNAVIYSGALLEHDCRVAAHAYLSPGVVLSGSVTVGEGAFLGAGAVVLPGVTIGARSLVAAGAVVTEDVAVGATVMGVPARRRSVPA
jgi:UDP-perosamine 4-acetyltransferase